MSDELEVDGGLYVLIWVVFGDLMLVLLGVFVLILVGVVVVQLELLQWLDQEVKQCQVEVKCLQMFEQVLVGLLVVGCVMLVDGCIGISGSVLFVFNFDQLQLEGQELLCSLVVLLVVYLGSCEEILMVSGFIDDVLVCEGNCCFVDNWELFVQCLLIVICILIVDGVFVDVVFVVVFGSEQLVSFNVNEEGCVCNCCVEIVLIFKFKVVDGK